MLLVMQHAHHDCRKQDNEVCTKVLHDGQHHPHNCVICAICRFGLALQWHACVVSFPDADMTAFVLHCEVCTDMCFLVISMRLA
jgi:hypothetical protein